MQSPCWTGNTDFAPRSIQRSNMSYGEIRNGHNIRPSTFHGINILQLQKKIRFSSGITPAFMQTCSSSKLISVSLSCYSHLRGLIPC